MRSVAVKVGYLLVLILLLQAPAIARAQLAYGGPEDSAFAAALWQELVEHGLAGVSAFQSQPFSGRHPHGAVLQIFRARVSVAGETNRAIILRNYGGPSVGIQAVSDDPSQYLDSITVMFKRRGYDPENRDWFWAKYLPDGSLATNNKAVLLAGRIGRNSSGCIACHQGATTGEMVFHQ